MQLANKDEQLAQLEIQIEVEQYRADLELSNTQLQCAMDTVAKYQQQLEVAEADVDATQCAIAGTESSSAIGCYRDASCHY